MTDTIAIKERFLRALTRGTGEAYQILIANPSIDFSRQIIKGATTNLAYDPQCEGSRAEYIYQLMGLSQKRDKIIDAVLAKLQTEKDDYWGLSQMADLAVLFFKEGKPEAQ